MESTTKKTGRTLTRHLTRLCLLALFSGLGQWAQAETIIIGKGSGIVWEGMPFSITLSGPLISTMSAPNIGLLAIVDSQSVCLPSSRLTTIAGYQALQIAPGVGLIPRASGTVNYALQDNSPASLTGTIGLPKTEGMVNGEAISVNDYAWCLPPKAALDTNYYSQGAQRTATLSGTWAVVTDGTQQTGEIALPVMYATTSSSVVPGRFFAPILPASTRLRITALDCTVNTPAMIDFGMVATTVGEQVELYSKTYPLITTCNQDSGQINANINLQFRALSGLYEGVRTRLALNEGGGYITGEMDIAGNGAGTGSGACYLTNTGVPFDSTQIKIGSITAVQNSKTFNNQITWRLCKGSNNISLGSVSAAAEMLVTFN